MDWLRKVGLCTFIGGIWFIAGISQQAYADTIFTDDFFDDPASNGWTETSSQFPVQGFSSTATGQIVPATVQGTEARFEKTGLVSGIKLNIDRMIDTTGFSNISFNMSAFQDFMGAYDALFGDPEPHNALRVEADYGSGFVLVFTDMQEWNGVEDTVGENAGSSIGGQLTNTATGLIPLSALADNNPNLKIRISWTTATLPNDFLLDNFELTGTSVPVTKTWDGSELNGLWEDPMNWTPEGVPNENDDVVINIDTLVKINSDVTIGPSGSVTASNNGDLRIAQSGKTLTIQGTYTINDGASDLIAREGTILIDCAGIVSLGQGQLIAQGFQTGGIIVNHGTVTGTLTGTPPGEDPISTDFNIVVQSGGLFQNSGTLPSAILIQPGGTFETIPSICNTDVDGDGFDRNVDDCDDEDASIHPGAQEVPYDGIDQDCDGFDLTDVDGDGFDWGAGTDCNDNDASIHPEAKEVADGIDNNCDGLVDENTKKSCEGLKNANEGGHGRKRGHDRAKENNNCT